MPESWKLALVLSSSLQPSSFKCLEEIVHKAVEGDGKVLVFVPVDLRDDDSWFEVTVVSVSTWCKVMSVLPLGSQLLQHMIIHCSFIEPSILHAFHNSKQMPLIRDVQYRFAFVSCRAPQLSLFLP